MPGGALKLVGRRMGKEQEQQNPTLMGFQEGTLCWSKVAKSKVSLKLATNQQSLLSLA